MTSGNVPIEISFPLSRPIVDGLDPITRIRYFVPGVVDSGIAAVMIPDFFELFVPMVTGKLKWPFTSDNCAVKTFPVLKVKSAV